MQEDNTCKNPCESNQYLGQNGECALCDAQCGSCRGSATNCTSCSESKFLEPRTMKCINKEQHMCEAGSFSSEANGTLRCQKCHETCETCTGPEFKQCTKCAKGLVKITEGTEVKCMMTCPEGHYLDPSIQTC